MPRNPNDRINTTKENGNLPQYKVGDNNCNIDMSQITMSDITLNNFREYHIKCPFSTSSYGIDSMHLVRNSNMTSAYYWNKLVVPEGQRSNHTVTSGIMAKWNRGSKYGWLCVDDNCSYYSGLTVTYSGEAAVVSNPGDRYFYY